MDKIKKWLGKLLLVVVLFGIIVGWQTWKQQQANDKAVPQLFKIVEGLRLPIVQSLADAFGL